MSVLLLRADAGRIPLADGSAHCCVTSPSYYGLRRYEGSAQVREWADGTRHALGNEPTPDLYVAHIVECFREVRRVLRDDGCAWVVLGDSFYNDPGSATNRQGMTGTLNAGKSEFPVRAATRGSQGRTKPPMPAGNLMLVPWRVALALQADGWVMRNDVVWAKRAAMPESVNGWEWSRCRVKTKSERRKNQARQAVALVPGHDHQRDVPNARPGTQGQDAWRDCPGCDRCASNGGLVLRRGSWRHTRAHETILMLTKSMGYYADAEAVAEPASPTSLARYEYGLHVTRDENALPQQHQRREVGIGSSDRMGDFVSSPATRNPRSYMLLGPEPLAAPHFAAYPTALIEPLIRATCPERVCAKCSAPWAVVVERRRGECEAQERPKRTAGMDSGTSTLSLSGSGSREWAERGARTAVTGHRPTCACDAGKSVPGTVLDPFCGSGTTLRVAVKLGRHGIGLDLSQSYLADIADRRTRGVQVEMPGSAP